LFETGVLHEKIKDVLSNVGNLTPGARRLTIFGALLAIAGLQEFSQLHFVSELVEFEESYEELRSIYDNQHLYGLIRMDMGEIAFRSHPRLPNLF
jgi:hypothetical protein